MKCEDFLPALEAGGLIGHVRAALHAVRCERCASARNRFFEARHAWAHPTNISPAHREVWQAATSTAAPERTAQSRPWPVAAAALLLMVFATWMIVSTAHRFGERTVSKHASKNVTPDHAVLEGGDELRLDEYRHGLHQLSLQLQELEKLADLIDARRNVELLSAKYRPLDIPQNNQPEAN